MKMRAAVLERFGEPLVVQEAELAEPRAGEVLVRLVACGVCHTDLYTAPGADPSGYAPAVLGHEGAGVVEAVGEGVGSLAPGDHVVTLFSPQCRECVHCVDERTNLCMAIRAEQNLGHLPDGTTRLRRDGEEIRHFMGCSTFAVLIAAPSPVERPQAKRHACSSGASGVTFASAISGITVYSANVDVPMKWRIGSPSRCRRVVPSGR